MSVESQSGRARRDRGAPGASSRDEAGQRLTGLLTPIVGAVGFDLEELRVEPAGRRRLVRLVVDADEGVNLDDVAKISQAVSAALDESDVMGSAPYVLEVTSPGVDRPLTEPRHWRRAVGRLVRAPLGAGGEIEGRVVAADDEAVVIDVEGDQRRLGLDELGRGRMQVEFRRDGTGDED
ncbi:ribosome maturation factor RimP [Actinomadura sp. HBU206391]|uniref:ribosome maturation factor RimP n=1 Tax=Actinomadura sp. HBU206391 TaxID=2731692 RepID=UPI00164FA9EA|nr:ribosome maturation factor RimP [Actinomadura sp. HBU206391]MBC6461476.1 ribosome maturation factor RimP [Actinomadura sp. HBU206391]